MRWRSVSSPSQRRLTALTQYIGIGTSGCRSWSVASVASKDLSNKRRLLISRIIPAAQGAHGLLSRHLNTHCSDDHAGAALPRVRVLGHEPTDMADGPRTWLMRIPSDAWVPRVLVADSTDVGGVRSAGQCDSGGATAEACAPARSREVYAAPSNLNTTNATSGATAL